MLGRAAAASFALFSVLAPGAALADSSSDGRVAESLFSEGRHLMSEGKLDEACPKLAESQRLDPAPGTALNLGICYERAGKTASAWFAFRDAEAAAASAGQKERAAVARKKAALLEASVPKVTVLVPSDVVIPGLEIRSDGAVLAQAGWGAALPMDPGIHEVIATAPGRQRWATTLRVEAGASRVSVTVPRLEPARSVVAVSQPPSPVNPPRVAWADTAPLANDRAPGTPSVADAGTSRGKVQRVAGIAVAGAGLVAVGVGAYFGLRAASTYHDALDACGGTPACTSDRGLQLRHDADPQMIAADVGFIAGAALLSGGAILYFTSPRAPAANKLGVNVGPSGAGGALGEVK
jgi:hypothetical protein